MINLKLTFSRKRSDRSDNRNFLERVLKIFHSLQRNHEIHEILSIRSIQTISSLIVEILPRNANILTYA